MSEPDRIEIAPWDDEVSMKPMLWRLVQEAVKLALIDCVVVDAAEDLAERRYGDRGRWHELTDELRARYSVDVYTIPDYLFARVDPGALAQNVANRLLGTGGLAVRGVYAGNASAQDLLGATFVRPDHRTVEDVAFDLQKAMDEADGTETERGDS